MKIHPTVVVECERCGAQSRPLLAAAAQDWLDDHQRRVHEPEDRARLLAAHGHVVTEVVEWFDQDDSSGHVECSCGFRSRSVKVVWLSDLADQHLKEMQQRLGLPDPSAVAPSVIETTPRSRPSSLAERDLAKEESP